MLSDLFQNQTKKETEAADFRFSILIFGELAPGACWYLFEVDHDNNEFFAGKDTHYLKGCQTFPAYFRFLDCCIHQINLHTLNKSLKNRLLGLGVCSVCNKIFVFLNQPKPQIMI